MKLAIRSTSFLIAGFLALLGVGCAPQATPSAEAPQAADSAEAPSAGAEAASQKVARKPVDAAASPVLARAVERGALIVGMTGEQPPFNVQNKDGVMIGLEVDLAGALAKSVGLKLQIEKKPFGELLGAMDRGEVDIIMSGMTMTPERNLNVSFVGPYFVSGRALLTKNAELARNDKSQTLNVETVRLTALEGSTSEQFVKLGAPKAKYTPSKTYDEGVQAVLDGKTDAMVTDLPLAAVTLMRNPNAGFVALGDPMSFEPIGIAIPASDPHLENLIANYVKLLEGTGLMNGLRAKWFGSDAWLNQLPPTVFGKPHDPQGRFGF